VSKWLPILLEELRDRGFGVVPGVLAAAELAALRATMYDVQAAIRREVGDQRLEAAGERGVLRLMPKFAHSLLVLLENPQILAVVDATLSDTAILHLQNGFILPSRPPGATIGDFQGTFHRDFPRHMNGYIASINVLLAVDDFTPDNGATLVVPGSHQRATPPDADYMKAHAVPATCAAGSIVVFDSTLWHCAGANVSGSDRLAINHQFTRSFIKQQIDYVRALGPELVARQPARTQQILGQYTRVVTSLDEYYPPESDRLYRKGQG
jgi:ectoine hydroxylase-related dioxygenase (phytanoyl-CoA dioxygenase family)